MDMSGLERVLSELSSAVSEAVIRTRRAVPVPYWRLAYFLGDSTDVEGGSTKSSSWSLLVALVAFAATALPLPLPLPLPFLPLVVVVIAS